MTIDVFDITAEERPDPPRPRRSCAGWRRCCAKAQSDGVQWTIVQGHVPILEPVRSRGSSDLRYPGGTSSALWKMFEKYGVDLYLAGEVHDTTASTSDGIVQLAHGARSSSR